MIYTGRSDRSDIGVFFTCDYVCACACAVCALTLVCVFVLGGGGGYFVSPPSRPCALCQSWERERERERVNEGSVNE